MNYILPLTLFAAPLYIWRFSMAGIPLNGLMLWVFFVWIFAGVWLLRSGLRNDFLNSIKQTPRVYLVAIAVFVCAGTLSLFVGGLTIPKVGQYIVLFIQPLTIFFLARYTWLTNPLARSWFLWSAFAFIFVSGAYALVQYATLVGVPIDWWGNPEEPKRALSFFLHPNFYALYTAPILAFLMPHTFSFIFKDEKRDWDIIWLKLILWGTGILGVLVSLSRGAWLGLAAAVIAWIVIQRSKRLWFALILALAIAFSGIWVIPSLHSRVMAPLQGERSSLARLSLWQTGWHMIQDNPVLGKGLLGFSENWDRYNRDTSLSHYPGPHNVFLHFWIDTGLIGLLSFILICAYAIVRSLSQRRDLYILGASLFLVTVVVHGLVDIPYFKNDLALLFWLILAFI